MIYKDVVGYEGLYQVSEHGDIIHLPRTVNSAKSSSGKRTTIKKLLKQNVNKYGYKYLLLADGNGIRKHYLVHQLVAKAFIDNPNNYIVLNHINEDKQDNHYSNLEWCTVRYNNLYNNRQEKINEKLKNSLVSRKPVLQFNLDNNFIQEFMSINDACRKLKLQKYPISQCCNGKKLSYKGFIWKFKEKGSTTIS